MSTAGTVRYNMYEISPRYRSIKASRCSFAQISSLLFSHYPGPRDSSYFAVASSNTLVFLMRRLNTDPLDSKVGLYGGRTPTYNKRRVRGTRQNRCATIN